MIQLCPWYMALNGAAKYTGLKGLLMRAGNALDKGTNFIEGLAQIDGMALLAHTILHEVRNRDSPIRLVQNANTFT